MTTLVTGGAGFIGSHVTEQLVARGEQVIVVDDLSTGRHDNIAQLPGQQVQFVRGSVLDAELVGQVMARCDAVFHLAAAVGVQLVVDRPLHSLLTNLRGTENVLEAAHLLAVPTLVASSSEVYGKNPSDMLGEDDDRILGSPQKSRWAYAEAKAIDEALAHGYWREKALPTVTVRLFNTVGPRQRGTYGMVLPRFVRQAVRGQSVTVFGDGRQTRCFCHVNDVVRAMIALLAQPSAHGRVFNIGGQEEISVLDLARRVITAAGSTSRIRFVPYAQAYGEGFEEMSRRVPDTRRVRDVIGWAPTLPLDAIVAELVERERALTTVARRSARAQGRRSARRRSAPPSAR